MQSGIKATLLLSFALASVGCQTAPTLDLAETATLKPFLSSTATATAASQITVPLETPSVPTATPFVHAIQEGETMIGIAVRYGLSLDELLIANPEVDPGFLSIGQEIIIPGSGGSTVSALLPTPTPVPVEALPVNCHSSSTDSLWCITQVNNQTGTPLEGVSLSISLVDSSGEVLDQINAYASLDIIPDGGVMPYAILLEQVPEEFAGAYVRVIGAVPAQDVETRYPALQIETQEITISIDGSQAEWHGSVELQTNIPGETGSLRAMLIGLDEEDRAVGYRLYEGEIGTVAGSRVEIDLTVFSLAPEIDNVLFFAEVEPR